MMVMEKSKNKGPGVYVRDIGKGAELAGAKVIIRVPAPTRTIEEKSIANDLNFELTI